MSIILNGSTGITTPAETATTSVTTPILTSASATSLTIQSGGTTAMTIDTSQNVGIGTSSPSAKLVVSGGDVLAFSQKFYSRISSSDANSVRGFYQTIDGSEYLHIYHNNTIAAFDVNGLTRMAIDSNGNLLVGQSSWSWSNNGTEILATGRIWNVSNTDYNMELGGSQTARVRFYTSAGGSGTTVGSISVTTSATAYNTSSDYRMKENVAPMTGGLATISALKPVTYDWVTDKSYGEGFIAHELAEIVPLAVTGEKDAVDDEGNIKPQGVDYSKIVVHLVAAIQELSAKNDTLAASNAALEARLAALEAK